MYQINLCSPFWDHSPGSDFNLKIIRILLLTVLFLLYLLYLVIHLILKKSVNNLKSEQSIQRLYEKQTFKQNWQREYLLMFGDHVIAVGFVLSFSPFQFEILLSFLFFVCRCVYEIQLHKFGKVLKILKTLLRVINLGLLICAIVGLSRTRWDQDMGVCRDRDYRPVTTL